MNDYQAGKVWEALNEGKSLDVSLKPEFINDCKVYGLLVAVYNLGWRHGVES